MAQMKQLIHIYPAFITYTGKTQVVITQVTQKYGATDCYDYYEAQLELWDYRISGRGTKI